MDPLSRGTLLPSNAGNRNSERERNASGGFTRDIPTIYQNTFQLLYYIIRLRLASLRVVGEKLLLNPFAGVTFQTEKAFHPPGVLHGVIPVAVVE